MASEIDHITLANRNHEALAALLASPNDHPEWVTTIAFYKALQIVEAMFAFRGIAHSNGHQRRLDILRDNKNGFQSIYKHYKRLIEASEIARYLSSRFDGDIRGAPFQTYNQYRSMENVKQKLLQDSLMNIEQHSRQFLSDQAKNLLIPVTSLFQS